MRRPVLSVTAPTLLVLTLTVALASCSSGSGGSGSGHDSPHSTAAPGGGTATKAAATSGTATCGVLTSADVQPLFAVRITGPKMTNGGPDLNGKGQGCVFGSENSESELGVFVYAGSDVNDIWTSERRGLAQPVSVPGVGEQAARDGSESTTDVDALGHGIFCRVTVADKGEIKGAAHLYDENGHHTEIGQPAEGTIAGALGTLCNRIFGSGQTIPDLSPLTTLHASPPASSGVLPTGLPTDFRVPTDGPTG